MLDSLVLAHIVTAIVATRGIVMINMIDSNKVVPISMVTNYT